MTPAQSLTAQRWFVWGGPAFAVVFFAGIAAAGWIPPPAPSQSAGAIAAMYREDTDRIRLGAALLAASAFFMAVWVAMVSRQLSRIEGAHPLYSTMQIAGGAANVCGISLMALVFGAAAFTPERDPEITAALHQVGFLCLVGLVWPAFAQCIAMGAGTLSDRSENPVFPRWFGFLNLWLAFGGCPGATIMFFHTGAFAWNGFAAFWIPATLLGAWFVVCFVVMSRAIADEAAQEAAAQAATAPAEGPRTEILVVEGEPSGARIASATALPDRVNS